MIRGLAHLPIRAWLILALVAIVAVPASTAWGLYSTQASQQQQERLRGPHVRAAESFIADNVSRWHDHAWQATARTTLAALNTDVQLFDANNRQVFATSSKSMSLAQHKAQAATAMVLDAGAAKWSNEKFTIGDPSGGKTWLGSVLLQYPRSRRAGADQKPPFTNLTVIRQYLSDNVARWEDPFWQGSARKLLNSLGVQVQLFRPGGRLVFSTLATSSRPAIGAGELDAINLKQLLAALPGSELFEIPNPHDKAPLGRAVLSYTGPPGPSWTAPALGGLLALLFTLSGVAWFLGRAVVRPLAAMSVAARGIAAGQLDVRLPASRAREVAEVTAALEAMSAELRAALQRQSDLEQERRLFIGAIAHDLRTPLFTLRAYLGGLEDGLARTPEKAGRYITVCREKADALERLIADLFAFTRLEYLEQTPRSEPLEFGALLRAAVEGLQPQATARGISLALGGLSPYCSLLGDRHLLTRAVENLLDNALRYTPPGGNVRVTCGQAARHLYFMVEDSGPGISPGDLPHLFTPLYRGETSRNRQTGGAGLGLAIAHRILLAHGGDLSADNRATGGAVFTGTLPTDPDNLERFNRPESYLVQLPVHGDGDSATR